MSLRYHETRVKNRLSKYQFNTINATYRKNRKIRMVKEKSGRQGVSRHL